MLVTTPIGMIAGALLVFPLLVCAHEIVVVGDSWGSEGKDAFVRSFSRRGHADVTILNIAVGGTTTGYWVRHNDTLQRAISNDTRHVWLSVGGNDLNYGLPGCGLKCVPRVVDEAVKNIRAIVAPALEVHPKLNVVQFGYDLLNLSVEKSLLCDALGIAVLPSCASRALEGPDPACFNAHQIDVPDLTPRAAAGRKPPLTKAAARTPPSNSLALPPRSGKLFAPPPSGPPLSLRNHTSVSSHSRCARSSRVRLPTDSSMYSPIAR